MYITVFFAMIAFFLGIIVGNLLNMVIFRLTKDIDGVNSKLDFLFNRKIQNIIVVILNSILWLLLFIKFGSSVELLASAFLVSLLIIMFFVDLRYQIIPDELVILGIIAGFILGIYNYFFHYKMYYSSSWWEPILGALSSSTVLLIVFIIGALIYKSDEALGLGDVKIFIPIGMFLGFQQSFLTLFITILISGFSAIIMMMFKVINRKSTFPLGPFIAVSTIFTVFFGHNIVSFYLNFLLG